MRICFFPEPRPVPEPGMENFIYNISKYFQVTDINHADINSVHGAYPAPVCDVMTCHGWFLQEEYGNEKYNENNIIFGNMHRAKEVIVTAQWLQNRLLDYKINSTYIPYGVSKRPSKKGGSYAFYPYRWRKGRNPRDIIELAKMMPDIEFKLCCIKPDDFISPPNITFLGEIISYSQLIPLYQEAAVIINPYRNEPMGEADLEGLAFGKPVLAPNSGVHPELLNSNVGYVYEDVDDMKIGLERLMNADMYEACLEESRKYDWGKIAQETERIYKNVWKVPVSIVVLAYNNHRTINNALQSCGNGSEIVLCDASQNHQAFKPERNRLVYMQTNNKSIGDNRNKAIERASQEYITFCDADDYLLDGKISQLYNWFSELPKEIGLVFGDGFYADTTFKQAIKEIRNIDLDHLSNITFEQLATNNFIPSGAIMFRKSAWKKVGGFPDINFAEDYGFYLRLLDAGYKILYLDVMAYVYDSLKNTESVSKNKEKRIEGIEYVLQESKKRFPERKINHMELGVI